MLIIARSFKADAGNEQTTHVRITFNWYRAVSSYRIASVSVSIEPVVEANPRRWIHATRILGIHTFVCAGACEISAC